MPPPLARDVNCASQKRDRNVTIHNHTLELRPKQGQVHHNWVLANLRTGLDQWTNTLTHYTQSSPQFIQVRLICGLALARNTDRCARR